MLVLEFCWAQQQFAAALDWLALATGSQASVCPSANLRVAVDMYNDVSAFGVGGLCCAFAFFVAQAQSLCVFVCNCGAAEDFEGIKRINLWRRKTINLGRDGQ
jgi:hypothetical protein